MVDFDPCVRGALAAEQSRDVSGSESDVPAHGQHDVRVILAYALALSERFLGGGADGGGGRRVDERFEHLVHHLTGLVDRRAVGRQGRDAFTADADQRFDGRPRHCQRRIEAVQRLVDFGFDMRVVHEGDAGHRVVEHGVRFGNESGHHHGIEGIDGGFEFHIRFDFDCHVDHLLAWAGGWNAAQLEAMVGHGRAE